MGALARVPIRLWPLAYGILIRALSSLDRALSNIFEGDSESAYPCDPYAHSKIEGPILYPKGHSCRFAGDVSRSAAGQMRDERES
jgi:hypothetical protein